MFGTVDSWLMFKLTGVHCTDVTNASRTLLFDLGEYTNDIIIMLLCDLTFMRGRIDVMPRTVISSKRDECNLSEQNSFVYL